MEKNNQTVKYYLAVDIGASSGRHILAHLEDGRIVLEEMYRFPNGIKEQNGRLVWDTEQLFKEILSGMRACAEAGKIPVSMGIDTWAVDYVLLDKSGERIGDAVAYRDGRTKGIDRKVYELIGEKELYARNGIQKQPFNTIYQLMAHKELCPDELERADRLLMIPDYFHYLLTGKAVTEYTNATTTQLVSPVTKDWDWELIELLSYPTGLFGKIEMPGTLLGELREETARMVGFNCKVVLPPTHDTASAVVSVPAKDDDVLYISSGTWSLMGTEQKEADCSEESRMHNFTNEGGYEYRYRYLKNIMGLWMIQSVQKEIGAGHSFAEICERASACGINSIVDCNDERFLSPKSMVEEVRSACADTGQTVPNGISEVAAVIYNSLAKCYAGTFEELKQMTGRKYFGIHIVGGGSNAEYLNRLTARAVGIPVYAGPAEATAAGNLVVQMIADGEMSGLAEARSCIYDSLPIKVYQP